MPIHSKYFAHKVKYDGHVFDSITERNRYADLLILKRQGIIKDLELQKEFEILPKLTKKVTVQLKTKTKTVERIEERAVKYHCDFYYYDTRTKTYVIEEVKSPATALVRDYPLRRKLIKHYVNYHNIFSDDEIELEFREIIGMALKKKKRKKTT